MKQTVSLNDKGQITMTLTPSEMELLVNKAYRLGYEDGKKGRTDDPRTET